MLSDLQSVGRRALIETPTAGEQAGTIYQILPDGSAMLHLDNFPQRPFRSNNWRLISERYTKRRHPL